MKPTKKKKKKDMIEGFLKYRKVKQNKDTPGPGYYNIDDLKVEGFIPLEDPSKTVTR